MVMCKCFSVFTRRKNANKVEEQASKGGLRSLHVKIERPGISSETDELKASTFDVTRGIQKSSRCNVRVMNLESPVKDEAEEAYEGEDEHEDSASIKRELSDMDLQSHANEADASKGGFDPRADEISFPILYEIKANNEFEDKIDKESHKSIDMIQSGHVSDPGVGKAVFWASPKLKRSCSDLERRDVFRNMTRQLPYSTSQSFEDLQGLSENQMDYLESPKSAVTHCSADRVMLKKHSSSQVLPSRSRKLWWKLFMWSHRNIHRPWFSKSTQLLPANAAAAAVASSRQCGYSSDILEPKQGKAVENVESPVSYTGESFGKLSIEEQTDNQRWGRFHIGESSMWPQNQWVAFSTESSPFTRVDEWVRDLETQEPLPLDGDDDNERSIVYPTSPDTGRSMARSTSRHPGANLSKEILYANSIVQSLNPASSAAHIAGVGLKAIPAVSHFSSLRSVNLSNNFIVHITPGLLPRGLHTLNLSRNKISTIEGLRELTRLRVLDLSYNRISRIGQGLSNCTLIKELYLAGNKISDFDGLHRLLKLTVLDMSFNKITTTKSLGQLVANFNSLQALNLLGNPIQSNVSEEQLRKAVCGLLPKLVYLNKQSIKPQRAREILTDSVAKAALGNSGRSYHRRAPKRGGQGGSLSSSRSSASVVQRSRNKSRSRTPSNQVPAKGTTR